MNLAYRAGWVVVLLPTLAACDGGGSHLTGDAADGEFVEAADADADPDVAADADADADPDLPDLGPDADADPDVAADADADADPDLPDLGPDADADPDVAADADADDGGPVLLPVGSPCSDGEECVDGVVAGECLRSLVGLTFPGGYCTGLGCATAADCPGGAGDTYCMPGESGPGWCADRCDPTAPDCRTGYVCVDPDPTGPLDAVCLPICRTTADCPAGQVCDTASRPPICRDPAAAGNGAACTGSAECAPGSACVAEDASFVGPFPASGPPGGVCIQACLADGDCTNGGVCVQRCDDENSTPGDDCDDDGTAGLDPEVSGICLEACDPSDAGACARTGYSCRAVGENLAGPRHVCAVDCDEGGCTIAGWECDPSAGFGSLEYGAGRCQPPFETAELGGACTFTSACTGGTCLDERLSGAPGGACIEECTGGMTSPDPCPAGSFCLARAGEIGICVPRCTPGGGECRDGWSCERAGLFNTCRPACSRNDQCDNDCCRADGTGTCDPEGLACL
jgi:hypothetical protein